MKLAILMSTFNGAKYLDKQFDSIFHQSVDAQITVYIRDDGSIDNTIDIIKKWTLNLDIVWYKGENIGPAKSFWELFTSKEINADYYAFCDQDDIWDSNKLQLGINALKKLEGEALWCSNYRIIDQEDRVINDRANKNFLNFSIISQFVCGTTQGCAMLLNNKLRTYILKKGIKTMPMHDFVIMTYAIAKGKIIYEDTPTFGYRVHSDNVIAKEGKNYFKHLQDSLRRWFSVEHKNELSTYAEIFMRDNIEFLDEPTYGYLNNLVESKEHLLCRFRMLFDKRTKATNKKAVRSFKIRVMLGII